MNNIRVCHAVCLSIFNIPGLVIIIIIILHPTLLEVLLMKAQWFIEHPTLLRQFMVQFVGLTSPLTIRDRKQFFVLENSSRTLRSNPSLLNPRSVTQPTLPRVQRRKQISDRFPRVVHLPCTSCCMRNMFER